MVWLMMVDSRLNMQKDIRNYSVVCIVCVYVVFCKKRNTENLLKCLGQSVKSTTTNSPTFLTTRYLPVILSFNAM
jgi:hypothetical protein